mmetsp:Transcript_56962/g.162281  ORF Transcript_56962/g.162281 Transcript_56962/m.162281 type:complete len:106 (+) Transcript_56962:3-320(+)
MRVFTARAYEGHGNDGAVLLVKPVDPELPDGLLSVRPQVLRSIAKGKKAKATVAEKDRLASSKPAAEERQTTAGSADPTPDEDEDEDKGPAFESRRSLRQSHPTS